MTDAGFAALAAARWIHFASVMLIFGGSLFAFYALPRQTAAPELADARGLLRLAAPIAFVSGIAWAGASLVNITGEADSLLDRQALSAFLFETGFGRAWVVRLAGLLVLLIAALSLRADLRERTFGAVLITIVAALLLVSQAWIGHPAAATGAERNLIIAGYALHVLGAGAWLGGLVPLSWMLRERERARGDEVEFALQRFSAVGMLAILSILAGGLVNAWARWNSFDVVLSSAWGKILIVKAVGFVALLALAFANRFVLMPRLAETGALRGKLARNVAAEQALGLAVLAAAAVLGILPPPA
ncbi:MAG: copper homeostasis membrane protein CopD [Methylobacteriaceae bacterium]|nr:copper homeostasis membrane protein CopD [Methylobacteriaceae bacterium]